MPKQHHTFKSWHVAFYEVLFFIKFSKHQHKNKQQQTKHKQETDTVGANVTIKDLSWTWNQEPEKFNDIVKKFHFSIMMVQRALMKAWNALHTLLSLADYLETLNAAIHSLCVHFEPLTSQTDSCGFLSCCRIWCPCSTFTTMTTWGTSPRSSILAEREGTSGWVPSSIYQPALPSTHAPSKCYTTSCMNDGT